MKTTEEKINELSMEQRSLVARMSTLTPEERERIAEISILIVEFTNGTKQ